MDEWTVFSAVNACLCSRAAVPGPPATKPAALAPVGPELTMLRPWRIVEKKP